MDDRTSRAMRRVLFLSFFLAVMFQEAPVSADEPGIARIGAFVGQVAVRRGDIDDTSAATVNAPLFVGDYLSAQDDSHGEVQFDWANVLRMGSDSQIRLTRLDPMRYGVQIGQGTLEVSVLAATPARTEVETPSVFVRPQQAGRYRIGILEDGSTQVTVRSGRADVVAGTNVLSLAAGSTLIASGAAPSVQVQMASALPPDAFDRWSDDRDHALAVVSPYGGYVIGASDLGAYGHWIYANGYGQVWAPYQNVGWAPYSQGRWVWEPYYGWTWVAAEPWGWAPYHYGRWFYDGSAIGWVWFPEQNARPIWRPALVAFFSFGAGGFSAGWGNVGWVPLAPREPFTPWWGNGYGNRTTIVNTVNVTNVHVTNVNVARTYRNLSAPGGAVVVNRQDFSQGNFNRHVAFTSSDIRRVSIAQGALPNVPTRRNLRFNANAVIAPIVPNARFARLHAPVVTKVLVEQQPALRRGAPEPAKHEAASAGNAARTTAVSGHPEKRMYVKPILKPMAAPRVAPHASSVKKAPHEKKEVKKEKD